MKQVPVIIIGAGPAGIAAAACLSKLSIPSLILEKDDCIASLWQKRSYDRLHLHLAKQFCELPHFPYPSTYPTFIPKAKFIEHMETYAKKFDVRTLFRREVTSVCFDEATSKWMILAMNSETKDVEEYKAKYVVIATGENDVPLIPDIDGMDGFEGRVLHSSKYKSGMDFKGKNVLVVGSGNSGMEIAYDLSSFGANTSIVVRSPFHIVSRDIWLFGMTIVKYLPVGLADAIVLFLCYLKFGDTSKHGVPRPSKGPLYFRANTTIYPVIDVGAFQKIKRGEIQVLPSATSIKDKSVTFSDGKVHYFDAIILATGYKSMVKSWLKNDDYLIDDSGMCKQKYPNHWKGKNGLYATGLISMGLSGLSEDAVSIANDINEELRSGKISEENVATKVEFPGIQ